MVVARRSLGMTLAFRAQWSGRRHHVGGASHRQADHAPLGTTARRCLRQHFARHSGLLRPTGHVVPEVRAWRRGMWAVPVHPSWQTGSRWAGALMSACSGLATMGCAGSGSRSCTSAREARGRARPATRRPSSSCCAGAAACACRAATRPFCNWMPCERTFSPSCLPPSTPHGALYSGSRPRAKPRWRSSARPARLASRPTPSCPPRSSGSRPEHRAGSARCGPSCRQDRL